MASHPIAKNRGFWNRTADAYQEAHGAGLGREPLAWGVWRLPEVELRVLGELAGRAVLELGCGAAQWSVALAQRGARVTGIDFSARQLAHARRHRDAAGVGLPLVRTDAERLPFADGSFDVVFCDHGATSWARPQRTVPEAARVLRPGGLFAFCISSPLHALCWDAATDSVGERLCNDYFGLATLEDPESVSYQAPYGEWLRLFRHHGLEVEDLLELRPPEAATTTYTDFVPHAWARRWPAENLWRLRRRPAPGR